jgi:hypothetical protein
MSGLILQWTSSVNNSILEAGTMEDRFKQTIWKMVQSLTSSANDGGLWTPVSCSKYTNTVSSGTDAYEVSSGGWTSSDDIKFPESMYEGDPSEIYAPTEHSWITLKREYSVNGAVTSSYMTIDCRYPLPPHVSSLSTVASPNRILGVSSYSTGTLKNIDITLRNKMEENAVTYESPTSFILNNTYGLTKRIPVADRGNFIIPSTITTPQDYSSTVVAFVDVVLNNKGILCEGESPQDEFLSYGTTRFRPKSPNHNDVISCWGFDYMNRNKSVDASLDDASSYKYHFHFDPKSLSFIFQTSRGDGRFSSMFGLVGLRNVDKKNTFPYTTITLNAYDPGLDTLSICKNTTGNQIIEVTVKNDGTGITDTVLEKKDVLNTYYNTCFRNYNYFYRGTDKTEKYQFGLTNNTGNKLNFSEGDNNPTTLPVFAPLLPKHSTILVDDTAGISYQTSSYIPEIFKHKAENIGGSLKYKWVAVDAIPSAATGSVSYSPTGSYSSYWSSVANNGIPLATKKGTIVRDVWLEIGKKYRPNKVKIKAISRRIKDPQYCYTDKNYAEYLPNINTLQYKVGILDDGLINDGVESQYFTNSKLSIYGINPKNTIEYDLLASTKTCAVSTQFENFGEGTTRYIWIPVIEKTNEPQKLLKSFNPPTAIKKTQENGINAFSVFKTINESGKHNPIFAAKLGFTAAADGSETVTDVYGTFDSAPLEAGDTFKKCTVSDKDKANVKFVSEIPIFLFSSNPSLPKVFGYVADICWTPIGLGDGQYALDPLDPSKYQKITWKGWTLPWCTEEDIDW